MLAVAYALSPVPVPAADGRLAPIALPFAVASSHAAKRNAFEEGLNAYRSKRYREAVRLFRRAIAENPSQPSGHYFPGLAYRKTGASDGALRAFRKALELRPDFHDARFSLALVLYRLERYDGAANEFLSVVEADDKNANAHFLLGLSYRALGNDAAAARHLRRAATGDATLAPSARFNLAVTYYRLKQMPKAKREFEAVRRLEPDGELAASAGEYLNIIARRERSARPWNLQIEAGMMRSNGVTRVEVDEVTGAADVAATFALSGAYKLLDADADTATVGYDFYQSIYDDITKQNFESHTAGLSIARSFKNWEAGLDYSFNYNLLDGKDFLRIHTAAPKLSYFPDPALFTQLLYEFATKDFFNDPDRDASVHRLGLSQFLFFADAAGYLLVGLQYENENADGARFDFQAGVFNTTLQLPLPWLFSARTAAKADPRWLGDLRAQLGFSFRHRDYSGVTPSIGEQRLDNIKTARFTLKETLIGGLSGKLKDQHNNTDSNLASVESAENVYSFLLSYKF